MAAHRTLVWFRNDLRLHDHEPLHRASQQSETLIPLYICDPRQFGKTRFGFPKTGPFRAQFWREALQDLKTSLEQRGSQLIVRYGQPEKIIPSLLQQHGISHLYYHREVTREELLIEQALAQNLTGLAVQCQGFWGTTLYHPEDLPFAISELPELFTHFRQAIEKKKITVRVTYPAPSALPPCPDVWPSAPPPNLEPENAIPDPRGVLSFVGGETAGLARVQHYFWQADCLKTYKETRNGMLGADYSSKFSPWLALGCLSPRYLYQQVKAYEGQRISNESTYWLIFELLWRDFFRFMAQKHGNRLFYQSGLRGVKVPWRLDWPAFEQWRTGQTGYPLVDANMRELAATGFMSNRGRQNVASFLTKNLGIDWRLGAEWFESCLIDYDVCSNWGNWSYTAGVGNDARQFRYFNIPKQSKDYDPQGAYLRHWLPELAGLPGAKIHEPWKLSTAEQKQFGVRLGIDYPRPMVDFFSSIQRQQRTFPGT
jgi:deoxyribodipyrimidine photo-lyase